MWQFTSGRSGHFEVRIVPGRGRSKRFDAPEEVGGPGFGGGKGGAPEGENLRALVDALEAFFGFGNGFDRGNPELLGARGVERDADALPAVFDAGGGARDGTAEAQILRSRRGREETGEFAGREKIEDGLYAQGQGLLQCGRERAFYFACHFAA